MTNPRYAIVCLTIACLSAPSLLRANARGDLRGPEDVLNACMRRLDWLLVDRHELRTSGGSTLTAMATTCAAHITDALEQGDRELAEALAADCNKSIDEVAKIIETRAGRITARCALLLERLHAPGKLLDRLADAYASVISRLTVLHQDAKDIVADALGGSIADNSSL